ncbi:NADP-reducing hydrogenase subunit HndA [mine drainage metagenome]|uniref:NADP-reducing hydrogenase subunit HndA n=1 Tax=mine drainage metagenome TaxID=410659 RepID=A0A1J5RKR9_9ZZZZ
MCEQKIDAIIEKYRGQPGSLIHALVEIQHENHWLPREVLQRLADALEVSFSQVMQIASFYKTFSLTPKGRHEVHVCSGMTCHLRGAAKLLARVEEITGLKAGETDADSRFTLETGACLGSCSIAPELIVDGKHYGRMTPDQAEAVLKSYE